MKLLALIALCAITSAHDIAQLKVPLYADPRRAAELSCHFLMDEQKLHSVKWYRDTNEIFRYSPTQEFSVTEMYEIGVIQTEMAGVTEDRKCVSRDSPTIRLFNVTDVKIQGGECFPDHCVVRVMPPPISTRAAYTCEVSTEGPKFLIARKTKHMTVVAMPEMDPEIIGAPKVMKPGEQIFLNCTSDFSLPASEINWYIDDELQKPEAWQKTEVTVNKGTGLKKSWRVLRLKVPTTASGSLRVRCASVLSVEPPVVRETKAVITIHSLTQLSKYVSNNSGTKVVYDTVMLIVTFIMSLTHNKISRSASL